MNHDSWIMNPDSWIHDSWFMTFLVPELMAHELHSMNVCLIHVYCTVYYLAEATVSYTEYFSSAIPATVNWL